MTIPIKPFKALCLDWSNKSRTADAEAGRACDEMDKRILGSTTLHYATSALELLRAYENPAATTQDFIALLKEFEKQAGIAKSGVLQAKTEYDRRGWQNRADNFTAIASQLRNLLERGKVFA